jgi:hypothetical protein
MGKDVQAVFTIVIMILGAAGLVNIGISQQTKEQTNGRMGAMQDQQTELINMVKDLALRVPPPPSGSEDGTQ